MGEGVARVDVVTASAAAMGLLPPMTAGLSLVLFGLDDARCAVDASRVVEILAAVAVRPLPAQPAYVAGIIDLRGTIVPVLDLRVRFGRPSRPMELSDQLIVVRAHDRLVALWVDGVEAFAPAETAALSSAGGLVVGDRSLLGVATLADGLATIHDVVAFVTQCEADAVFEAAGV